MTKEGDSIKECKEIIDQAYDEGLDTYKTSKESQYKDYTVSIDCKPGSKSDSNSDSKSNSNSDSKFLQLRILSLFFLIITILFYFIF